jgi:DNA-binding CsgD family transcriptional regulator
VLEAPSVVALGKLKIHTGDEHGAAEMAEIAKIIRRRIITPKRPSTGWDALTSTEAAVAQFASEGKTNREIAETLFISPHTVNSHLRHIFDKLGVNSRVSLTRMAGAAQDMA